MGIHFLNCFFSAVDPVSPSPRSPTRRRSSLDASADSRLSRSKSDMLTAKPTQVTPTRVNPFSQRQDLNGGRIKLFDTPSKSVISLTFTLPPPPDPCSPTQCKRVFPRLHRRCQSLPCTPEDVQLLRNQNESECTSNVLDTEDSEETPNLGNVLDSDSVANLYTETAHDAVFTTPTDTHADSTCILRAMDSNGSSPAYNRQRPKHVLDAREEQKNEQEKDSIEKEGQEGEKNSKEKIKGYCLQSDDSGLPIDLELVSVDRLVEDSVEEEMDCSSSSNTPDGTVPDSPDSKPFTNGWSPPVVNGPPSLPPLPDLENNNSEVLPLDLAVNGFGGAETPVTPQEPEEVMACSGCCLAGLSFPSMCVRGTRQNPYKNLNGDSTTKRLLCRVQLPSPPEPSLAVPSTHT